MAVVLITQASGLATLLVVVPLLPAAHPSAADLLWGSAASISGSAGVALLYRALAIGTMAVVAPTTAVCAAAIPVIAGVLAGERVAPLAWAGIAIAAVAIVLVGQERTRHSHVDAGRGTIPPGLVLALWSGVAIGGFFLALARTSSAAGMWPLVVSRGQSVAIFALMVAAGGVSLRLPRRLLALAVIAGVLDVVANGLYVLSTWSGPLPVVVTLASLYPASTVLLARFVLRERLNRLQVAGVICALLAVVLIVGG